MRDMKQLNDLVNDVWQLCKYNSKAFDDLPTLPLNSSALEVDGINVAGWRALERRNEFHKLNGIAFLNEKSGKVVVMGQENKPGDYYHIDSIKAGDAGRYYVGDCCWCANVIARVTNCAVRVVTQDCVAHMVRSLVEEGIGPEKIIIFNRSGNIELTKLISAQRGCGWIDCSRLKMENLISPQEISGAGLDIENNRQAILKPAFNQTITQPLSFTPDHLKNLKPLKWIVKGKIPTQSLNAIYGVSGAGKTFVALHLAAAIATGTPWLGHKTKKCPVLYLALESAEGFALRLDAYKSVNGHQSLDGLHVWTRRFSFAEPDDVSLLIKHIRGGGFGGGIIFIDTLARAMVNWDENSAIDIGKLIDVCQKISKETGCAIMLVAHAGKSQQAGIRGHSMLIGALDSSIEVRFSGGERKLFLGKIKEGEDGVEYPFTLTPVHLGIDEDGQPITSCNITYG